MRLLILILLIISFSPAYAEEEVIKAGFGRGCLLTRNINVDELKDNAGIIFRGTFLKSEYKEENGLSIRELSFKVIDPIKGLSKNQETIKLKEWANFATPFSDGTVAQNKEYVFFFHEPSPRDLTSLAGLDQGLVAIDDRNAVHFSKRLSMQRKPSLAAKLFSSAETKQTANITSYSDLKNFFQ